VNIIQARSRATAHHYPRLGKALAYVYVDILRFCYSVCVRFSKKKQGIFGFLIEARQLCGLSNRVCVEWRLRASFIGRITWKPLRAHFSDILEALEEHKKLLVLELSNASTAEAMKFYTRVERRINDISFPPRDKDPEEEIEDRGMEVSIHHIL
jgi:hypothetical protein